MKASAYVSGINYATESWLISPVINMSSAVKPVLSFMTVARYGSNANLTLWAREKGGDWAQLSFSNYGTGNDWNFVSNTVDLSAYAGKTLQFAYKYVSTGTGASTWEIKNVEVKEQGATATLSSIAWTGYTTTYTVGDVFKADGTVTATYSDGSTKDVTSEASFSTPDMSTAGAKTVTITYEGETTTGEITVKAAGSAEEKSEEIVLANGTYSGTGTNGIITWSGTSCSFVQTKESSSTNVNSSYVAAPRWYASHKVTFTANTGYTITKVVVVCTSSSYANALKSSTYSDGASASVSNNTVTITTSGDFSVTMGAQSRISSVTVYYTE